MKKETTPDPKTETDKKYSSNLFALFIKTNLLAIFFTLVLFLVTALAAGAWGYTKLNKFSQAAGISISELRTKIEEGLRQEPIQTNNHKNILLLGVDSLSGRGDAPPLTDTIMLMSVDLETGKINTLPLPRDLWSQEYKTKINALYFYGLEKYPDQPEKFTKETIEEMTDLEIHHTLVLSLDKLEELIDLLGGISVNVPVGFTDEEFPRPGVDVAVERDPKILYQTISFEEGEKTLSGEKALQYIRSRHSDGDEGTDISRGDRQQLVIKAIFNKLMNIKQYVKNPELAGKIYRFYDDDFSSVFPLEEIISTGKNLVNKRDQITIKGHQLSTTKEDPKTGVLDNPRPSYLYQNQWVYVINDQDLFEQEIKNSLFNN